MSRAYRVTFCGFTGATFCIDVIAYSISEAEQMAREHMCAGDSVTVEEA